MERFLAKARELFPDFAPELFFGSIYWLKDEPGTRYSVKIWIPEEGRTHSLPVFADDKALRASTWEEAFENLGRRIREHVPRAAGVKIPAVLAGRDIAADKEMVRMFLGDEKVYKKELRYRIMNNFPVKEWEADKMIAFWLANKMLARMGKKKNPKYYLNQDI